MTANPDFQIATIQRSESYFYEHVISVDVSIENAEGEQVVLTNGLGRNLLPRNNGIDVDVYVRIAKPRDGDGWVIIPWPSEAEGRILLG